MNLQNYLKGIWVLKNPTIVYRTIKGFIRALIFGKNTLKTIEIFPTLDCNLHCQMCSVSKFKKQNESYLNLSDYQHLAKQGARLGAIAVQILGGEPLLAKNLKQIIQIFKKEKYFIYLVSNGALANYENLKELHSHGLDSICFSLDSLNEEICDRIRGTKKHVKKVFQAIKIAKDAGLQVRLAPVFFPGHIQDGIEVIRYCKKNKIGASGGQMAPVGEAGNSPILTSEENKQIRDLLKFYPELTFDWSMSYFLKMRCPAGKEKIAVTSYGDVIGCSLNPISFGNIKEEPLEIIVKRMGSFSQFKKDGPVCLAAEDRVYIENYLRPLANNHQQPISYKDHPFITMDAENALFLKEYKKIPLENISCPLCGAARYSLENSGLDYQYWTTTHYFQFVKCKNCGHLYQNPRPSSRAAEVIYPDNYYSFTAKHSKNKISLIRIIKEKIMLNRLRPLKQYLKRSCNILEVGCGDGQLLLVLKKQNQQTNCTGVDLYFSDLTKSKLRKAGINFYQSNIEDLDLPSNEYDLIIMNQLIEHLWDLNKVMAKLKIALAPGGRISIETVNTDGYDKSLFKNGCWGGYYFPRHMNLFGFASLKKFIEGHGLIVEKQTNLVAPICWIFSCNAWLQKKFGKNNLLSGFFQDTNPFVLAIFTIIDFLAIKMGAVSANQKMIAQKPTSNFVEEEKIS